MPYDLSNSIVLHNALVNGLMEIMPEMDGIFNSDVSLDGNMKVTSFLTVMMALEQSSRFQTFWSLERPYRTDFIDRDASNTGVTVDTVSRLLL
jgi:hypothetical protein